MDPKLSSIRPHQAARVPAPGRRRREPGQGKAFELPREGAPPPPDTTPIPERDEAERSVAPLDGDEAGARLDITA